MIGRAHRKKNAYRILAGKPKRNRPLGRPRYKWEDNSGQETVEGYC
jgi:hypothetical protein